MNRILYVPLDERACNYEFPALLAGMTEDVALAVSYTHLDVYKRQEYVRGYDSIRNDPALTGWARNMIAQTFGTQAVHELSPIAPGDDFCYYDQVCPGFFLELGAANPEKALLHHRFHSMNSDISFRISG